MNTNYKLKSADGLVVMEIYIHNESSDVPMTYDFNPNVIDIQKDVIEKFKEYRQEMLIHNLDFINRTMKNLETYSKIIEMSPDKVYQFLQSKINLLLHIFSSEYLFDLEMNESRND